MPQVNIHEAKTHLSRLVDQAAAGEEIVIARAGKPIARLVALESLRPPRRLGLLARHVQVAEDFDVRATNLRAMTDEKGAEPGAPGRLAHCLVREGDVVSPLGSTDWEAAR